MLKNSKGAYRGKHARESEECASFTASLNSAVDGLAKTPQKRKALWAAAFIVAIAALVLGARLTYTAFTASDYLKAVPVTGESQSLFASDTLAPYAQAPSDSDLALRLVTVDSPSSGQCSFSFRIYNCMLDDTNVFNDKDVVYVLSVTAAKADGTPVTDGWNVSPATEVEATLPGTKGVINTYTISFDKNLIDNVTFTIRATVDEGKSPGTNLYCLAAKVSPAQRAVVESASVSGSWADGSNSVISYGAYNYRVTVTGKQQRVTLSWGEGVELDRHFEANHSGCTIDRNARTVTYTARPGSETVNFYRVGNNVPSSWDSLGVQVKAAE